MNPSPKQVAKELVCGSIKTMCLVALSEQEKIDAIATAISKAEEIGFARGQEKKASCICHAELGPCELHEWMISKAVEDEREANCKAVCLGCQQEAKLLKANDYEVWFHVCVKRSGGLYNDTCSATAIRARGSKKEVGDEMD